MMKLTLQELIEQKALLEKHLKWLEQKIADTRTELELETAKLAPERTKSITPNPLPPGAPNRHGAEETDKPAHTPAPDFIGTTQFERPFEVTWKTKFGCWMFALAAIAGFLFLLFVLPYLIK